MAYAIAKRVLDIVLASLALAVTAPFWLAVAVAVKLEDGGPVLYSAPRVGRNGRMFSMRKFRTMVLNADQMGGASTADDDPRITAAGHWIRRWKLDELPQLVNVIRGDMSLVGPRPQVPADVQRYTEDERRLLTVRPGMTDWASIRFRNEGAILSGHRDADQAYDRLIRPEKSALGLRYIDERSLRTDWDILRMTISVLLRRQRAGADPTRQKHSGEMHADSGRGVRRL